MPLTRSFPFGRGLLLALLALHAAPAAAAETPAQRLEAIERLVRDDDCDLAVRNALVLIVRFPDAEEALRARRIRADCLWELGRDWESLDELEDLADRASGSRTGALALLTRAIRLETLGEHDRARLAWRRLAEDYAELEPGLGRMARRSADEPPLLIFGPFGDRLHGRILRVLQRWLNAATGLTTSTLSWTLTALSLKGMTLGLAFVLFLALYPKAKDRGESLLGPSWGVGRVCLLFLGVGLGNLLVTLGFAMLLDLRRIDVMLAVQMQVPAGLLPALVATAVILRSVPPSRLYAWPVPWRRGMAAVLLGMAVYWSVVLGLRLLGHLLAREPPWRAYSGIEGSPFRVVPLHLLVAVVEETLYRGALQQSLRRHVKPWAAILVTAFVFAGFHVSSAAAPVLLLLFGLVAGTLVERTRSLAPAIWFHWISNVAAGLLF